MYTLKPFRIWCQNVLPLVYDESLSYYEVLAKVVDYLNKTMSNVDELSDSFVELQNYVNHYFDNLDVQENINNKLDEMASDGTLSELLSPIVDSKLSDVVEEQIDGAVQRHIGNAVAEQIGDVVAEQIGNSVEELVPEEVARTIGAAVSNQIGATVASQLPTVVAGAIEEPVAESVGDWLDDHVSSGDVVVDDTLSISGAAADAKATGDKIKSTFDSINDAVGSMNGVLFGNFNNGMYRLAAVGNTISGTIEADNTMVCCKVPCQAGEKITIKGDGSSGIYRLYAVTDSNNVVVAYASNYMTGVTEITCPANSAYCYVNVLKSSDSYYVIVGTSNYFSEIKDVIGALKSIDGSQVYSFEAGAYRLAVVGGVINGDKSNIVGMRCAKIRCGGGDEIFVHGTATSGIYRMLAFADENNTSLYLSDDNLDGEYRFVAPTGSYWCYVNILSTSVNPCLYKNYPVGFYIKDAIQRGFGNVIGATLGFFKVGCYHISATGDVMSDIADDSSSMMCSALRCNEGDKVTISGTGSTGIYVRWAFVDTNNVVLWRADSNENEVRTITAPTGSHKVYVNLFKNQGNPYVYVGGNLKSQVDNIDERVSALEGDSDASYPAYYRDHVNTKINELNRKLNVMSNNNDSFIFVTDYHFTGNSGHSPAIVNDIFSKTGISKLFFGGDAGHSEPYITKYNVPKYNCPVYAKFGNSVPYMYPIIGNHEWNDIQDETHEAETQQEVFVRTGVVNNYIKRCQQYVKEMSIEGNYYFTLPNSKLFYICLQCTGQARVTNDSCAWLIETLAKVPENYFVIVFFHSAYDGWAHLENHELYYGDRCRMSTIRINEILGAYKNRLAGNIPMLNNLSETYGEIPYDFSSANGDVVCVVSGHIHKDFSIVQDGIRNIFTTTDAYDYNEDSSTDREEGTYTEQAFDVFQIDVNARKIYTTRIGAGLDREFDF